MSNNNYKQKFCILLAGDLKSRLGGKITLKNNYFILPSSFYSLS